MGEQIRLTAADGHTVNAYRSTPAEPRPGGIVVVQEIFGVNAHIRDIADRFAAAGYAAIAPALFDRVRPGVELDYTADGIAEGRELASAIGWDGPALDIEAAARALGPVERAGVVGYCWGASWVWVAAGRSAFGAAVCYYGRHIVDFLDAAPKAPTMLHFGGEDGSIPPANVEKIGAAWPALTIHLYPGAGHGFNCDRRADFRAEAAALALQRTLAFFAEHLR